MNLASPCESKEPKSHSPTLDIFEASNLRLYFRPASPSALDAFTHEPEALQPEILNPTSDAFAPNPGVMPQP